MAAANLNTIRATIEARLTAELTSLTATYTQTGTVVTINATAHGYHVGQLLTLDYTSGGGVDGTFTVVTTATNSFTVTAAGALTTSGNVTVVSSLGSTLPVVFHNQPYVPTPNSSWVQCLVSFGANEYLTLGGTTGSSNSIIGVVAINIFTPLGVGPGANLTIGKRVRDLYNRQVVSGVHFDPPTGPEVVAAPAPEGYFQTQVRMTFETFEDL
jgi:hypothetical protein